MTSSAPHPPRPGTGLGVLAAVLALALAAGIIAVVAVAGRGTTVTRSRAAADAPCPPTGPLDPPALVKGWQAELVATATSPTWFAGDPVRPGTGVLLERAGRVRRVAGGEVTADVVLDLSDVTDTDETSDGGLLAAAYEPDASWLYVYRSTPDFDDELTAHALDATGRPTGERRVILHVDRVPSKQHHGGSLAIDADGLLHLALGDGGGLGDPRENAQDRTSLLGKVLRIDPTPDGDRPYRIPPDNPFVDVAGWRAEIWALGVRNPFRLSIDPDTGEVWLGDVGQTCVEELNRLGPDDAGVNLGWDRREGDRDFEGGEVVGRYLPPVLTRPHAAGWCAIVPGYVVRDLSEPTADGLLLTTDYCAGRVLGVSRPPGSEEVTLVDLGVHVEAPVAIVPGPAGRPWVLSLDGPILELRR